MKIVEKHVFKQPERAECSEKLIAEIMGEVKKNEAELTRMDGNIYIVHSSGRNETTNFQFFPGRYCPHTIDVKGLAIFVNIKNGKAYELSETDIYRVKMILDPRLYPTNEEIYSMAIGIYGGEKQSLKALEEASEFSQALAKDLRDGGNRENIILELADLENTLEQVKEIYKVEPHELAAAKTYKMRRLYNKMEKIPEMMDKFAEIIKGPIKEERNESSSKRSREKTTG